MLLEVYNAGHSLRQLKYFSSCSKDAFLIRERFSFCSQAVFLSLIFYRLALDKYSNFLSCLFNQSGITLDLLLFLKGLSIIYQSKTFSVLTLLLLLVLLSPRSSICEVLILIILISLQNTICYSGIYIFQLLIIDQLINMLCYFWLQQQIYTHFNQLYLYGNKIILFFYKSICRLSFYLIIIISSIIIKQKLSQVKFNKVWNLLKQMKAQKEEKQFTIKEFQWYEVQTKVRQIMADLLQPFNKKQTEQSIKINQMKRNIATMSKKIEDFDFLLERQNAIKPRYIEIQDEKIAQMEQAILHHKSITNTDIKKMQVTIQVYQQKITQLNQLQKRLDHQVIERVQNFKKYKQHVDESINLMMKKIQSQQDEINLLKSTTRTQINKLQTKMVSYDNRLKDLQDQVKRKTSQLNRLVQESINHNQKIIKAQLKIIDVVNRVQQRQKDVKLSEKFFGKVKQVQNDLQFIYRYIQAYQPLYVQMQISQALDIIVKGRQRRKLCIFQQKRFAKLHNHILLNEANNLQDLMSTFSNNIRKIINRNRKYIINLKVQESVKYGANLYEFRDDQQANNYHDEEDDQNKKQVSIVIPQQDIERILQRKWTTMLPQVAIHVQNEIKPTRQWMKQVQQQAVLRSVDSQNKFYQVKQKISSIQAQQGLIQKHYSSEIVYLKEKSIDQQERNQIVRSYIKDILNFNSVLNHIVIQDEIDRQGTALYALKSGKHESENKISPTIQLDPSCVNCDHKTSNIINQAFKMACLAYNPSQIRIDDQYFSREQILEISTNILERLKKKLDGLQQKKSSKILTRGKEEEENTYQKKQRKSQTIAVNAKDSAQLSSRNNRNSSKNSTNSFDKQKNLQTMLPVLSSSSKKNRLDVKQRNTHLSVFY